MPMKHNYPFFTPYILILFCTIITSNLFSQIIVNDFESGTDGWTPSGNATDGLFETGIPRPQSFAGVLIEPRDPHTPGISLNALFTEAGVFTGANDVDNGNAIATSPTYNITSNSEFSLWYFFGQYLFSNNLSNSFRIEYSLNGGISYPFELIDINTNTNIDAIWRFATSPTIPAGSQLKIRVVVTDNSPGDYVEGGIDDVTITPQTPQISINDIIVDENAGEAILTITHSGFDATGSFNIQYATQDNTALAGQDYAMSQGSLSFSGNSGENQQVRVPIIFDPTTEPTESFFVNLSSSALVTLIDNAGIVTINDISTDIDIDGDGIPNKDDVDNDNDGIIDCLENGALDNTISDIFSVNGNATRASDFEAILTPNTNSQSGSITIIDKIDFSESFDFTFEAYLGNNNNGADGIAIIFHNDPNGASTVGTPGEGLGAAGIQNGIVLELDTYNNGNIIGDITNDHGMIWDSDQGTQLTIASDLGNIEDDAWHTVNLQWSADDLTISYTVDGILAGQLNQDLVNNYFGGAQKVFFGFSASTGGSSNEHRIRFQNLCQIPLFVDQDLDGIPNYLDIDSDNDGILDIVETGNAALDTNNDGIITRLDIGFSDNNNDGHADSLESFTILPNNDTDTLPDFIDTDSDDDSCYDSIEASGSFSLSDIDTTGALTGTTLPNGLPLLAAPAGQDTNTRVTTPSIVNITTQPINQVASSGKDINFSVSANGNESLTYQWEESSDGGINWSVLNDGGTTPEIQGSDSETLTFKKVPLNYNNRRYRVIIFNPNSDCTNTISSEVILLVRLGTVITNRRITHRVKPK